MGTDPRKRQKKLERRAAKRKEKKHLLVREQHAGLPQRLAAAAKFPVLDCTISNSLEPEGIGWVLLSREFPNSQVAAASFLVDRWCLGVKDVHAEVVSGADYDSKYRRKLATDMPSRRVTPAEARKLLEQAVAYARGLGLPPHADYPKAMILFGDVDAAESNAQFEFGKDGKPFFFAGPRDTPERCRRIMAILNATCGPGNFDFFAAVDRGDLERGLERGEIRLLGPVDESGDELEDLDEDEG
jgi:hypothetical protein